MNLTQSEEKSINFISYEDLKLWLLEEIGEVPIETILKHSPPKVIGDLSSLTEKQANKQLKNIFIEHFLSKTDYQHQLKFLSQTTPRETRLKISSPLPSTDFSILLKKPVQEIGYLQRAAALTYAAGNLHLRFVSGDLSTELSSKRKSNGSIYNNIFANTIIAGEFENQVCTSKDSTHINVLVKGNAYWVEIIENGQLITPENIYFQFKKILENSSKTGFIGLLRCVPLKQVFEINKKLKVEALNILHSALFTVCLDELTSEPSKVENLNDLSTALFSGNRTNRWYGSCQIIVRSDTEAGFIFSYMTGVEGVQANEVANELYNKSAEIDWTNLKTVTREVRVHKIDLGIPDSLKESLQSESESLFHKANSVFTLPIGTNFFKNIKVSPNIAIHFLLMLAFKDAGNLSYLPETSQAIVVREQFWGGVQLDWLRARPEFLRKFMESPTDISLFRETLEAHKTLILKSRKSLSPFLFFDNLATDKDSELINFYLSLGQEEKVAAYRHYLCPISRNPKALDIITSSLKLWGGIRLIGRAGTRSKLVNISGSHILFQEEETHIVFTPTFAWENRLPDVISRLLDWTQHLSTLNK